MDELNPTLDARLRTAVRDVPDFPKPGIVFKDITPVLLDAALFRSVTDAMAAWATGLDITHVVGIESRGFIFGAPVAQALGVSFVPMRKPGAGTPSICGMTRISRVSDFSNVSTTVAGTICTTWTPNGPRTSSGVSWKSWRPGPAGWRSRTATRSPGPMRLSASDEPRIHSPTQASNARTIPPASRCRSCRRAT